MTPKQIELARHALGLPNKARKSYRNHYVTGGGEDYAEWMSMKEDGNARHTKGNQLTGGEDLFWLTAKGAALALKPREKLDAEDFPT